ncbi:hypothetical protein, variant [Phialophora macrospora]|uniref:Uncharacterized protein n=1 Tax=Phialophora macrospora TaxID=1851006 RepID=A0A0D2CY51_9EURO|nr:hypothetical protein, variant [Phialophora macrospora]
MAVPQSIRNHHHISPSKVRLHLQTIFSHNPLHRSTKSPSSDMTSPTSSSVPSIRSSPSSSFCSFGSRSRSRVQAPSNDLASAILSPVSPLASNLNPSSIRRQPSAIDLALQEEIMYADEVETIGLGLFEPRPRANTASSTASSQQCSIMEFMSETAVTPVVLDSIFDVMERA